MSLKKKTLGQAVNKAQTILNIEKEPPMAMPTGFIQITQSSSGKSLQNQGDQVVSPSVNRMVAWMELPKENIRTGGIQYQEGKTFYEEEQ